MMWWDRRGLKPGRWCTTGDGCIYQMVIFLILIKIEKIKCTVRLFGDGDGGGEENCHFPQRQRDAEGWKHFSFFIFLETSNIFHG